MSSERPPALSFSLVVPLEQCVQGKGAESMTSRGQNQQVWETEVSKAKFQWILTAQSYNSDKLKWAKQIVKFF